MSGEPGPDPDKIASLTDLARELDLLRCRAARGTGKARVSLTDLADRVDLPRSTVHTYVAGRTLAPADVLDRIVIALGATPAQQARWSEAWFRVAEHQHSTPSAVPRQLPMDAAGFTGRRAELDELDSQTATILSIVGTAGVGKTALAVHWSHRVAKRFRDGQLYINLRGFETDHAPITPDEALGRFLRALDVDPAKIPRDVEERAALFRSTIADRRMLVLLDNAATVEQVRPLLPGTAQCLITSRNQLTGLVAVDGAHSLLLDVLDPTDAVTLLDTMLGARVAREVHASKELARLCGYLPLALRVAAGKLVMRPGHKVADAVADFVTSGRLTALEIEGADVRMSIALSYDALDPPLRKLLRRLGLIATPDWPVWVAQELLSETEPADRLLERLADAHLVEPLGRDPAGQLRYRLHDLVAEFAKERVLAEDSPDERDRAMERMLSGWLALAGEADLLLPHGTDFGADLASPEPPANATTAVRESPGEWFQVELPGLLAAFEEACRRNLAAIGGTLALRMSGFLTLRAYDTEREHLFRAATERFREDPIVLRLLGALYEAYAQTERMQELPALAAERLALARQHGDREVEALALCQAGRAARLLGRLDEAADWLTQAVEASRGLDIATISACLGSLANLHVDSGDSDRALPLFEEALDVLGDLRRSREGALKLHRYAVALIEVDRLDDAERILAEALDLTAEMDEETGTAFMDLVYADVDTRRGRWTDATDRIERSQSIAERLHNRYLTAEALRCRTDLLASRQHPDAIAVALQALKAWEDLELPADVARVLIRLDRLGAGEQYGRRARAIMTDLGIGERAMRLPPSLK